MAAFCKGVEKTHSDLFKHLGYIHVGGCYPCAREVSVSFHINTVEYDFRSSPEYSGKSCIALPC